MSAMRTIPAFSPRWWCAVVGVLLLLASVVLWTITASTVWGLLGGVGVTIAVVAWQPDRHR